MKKDLRETLFLMQDEAYRDFSKKLLPKGEALIGVRLPELKKLAKEMAKGDWQTFVSSYETAYLEEDLLKAFVLGFAKTDLDERLFYIEKFVPTIKNWSVCDSFCAALKEVRKEPERVFHWIDPYLHSKEEYEVRFGVVMMLDHFINDDYIDLVLERLDRVCHPGYYAKMAVAWALSVIVSQYKEKTLAYLKSGHLDVFTFHKTIQKCIESRRIDDETKAVLRKMRKNRIDA